MALQMKYTCLAGITHANSYWVVSRVDLKPIESTALVLIDCYHNKATRTAGFDAIISRSYGVNAKVYPDYFSTDLLKKSDPVAQGYLLAKQTPESDGSFFFNDALDV